VQSALVINMRRRSHESGNSQFGLCSCGLWSKLEAKNQFD